ncbi:hypothetical protein R75461_03088 [Paraburkholderia nemoris]|jgi:hypothetical protein|uniref:hypothetical protein n=1 Tax=Paraburkholderia nemoris TaxID=2793076 RepID=UPI00190B6D7A|nr:MULTISPECIES: hypothetical protein [Paraburkholderia]MBK3782317.1 hypothetical protein [Paraburkholderia aspalathi]CAE6754490.1 hypothetical protein R75461_03088 [Paraburkholderia nemoris]
MKIEVTDVRNAQDEAYVASQLGAYTAAFAVKDFKSLHVFARDGDGSIVGGLLADMLLYAFHSTDLAEVKNGAAIQSDSIYL